MALTLATLSIHGKLDNKLTAQMFASLTFGSPTGRCVKCEAMLDVLPWKHNTRSYATKYCKVVCFCCVKGERACKSANQSVVAALVVIKTQV